MNALSNNVLIYFMHVSRELSMFFLRMTEELLPLVWCIHLHIADSVELYLNDVWPPCRLLEVLYWIWMRKVQAVDLQNLMTADLFSKWFHPFIKSKMRIQLPPGSLDDIISWSSAECILLFLTCRTVILQAENDREREEVSCELYVVKRGKTRSNIMQL